MWRGCRREAWPLAWAALRPPPPRARVPAQGRAASAGLLVRGGQGDGPRQRMHPQRPPARALAASIVPAAAPPGPARPAFNAAPRRAAWAAPGRRLGPSAEDRRPGLGGGPGGRSRACRAAPESVGPDPGTERPGFPRPGSAGRRLLQTRGPPAPSAGRRWRPLDGYPSCRPAGRRAQAATRRPLKLAGREAWATGPS